MRARVGRRARNAPQAAAVLAYAQSARARVALEVAAAPAPAPASLRDAAGPERSAIGSAPAQLRFVAVDSQRPPGAAICYALPASAAATAAQPPSSVPRLSLGSDGGVPELRLLLQDALGNVPGEDVLQRVAAEVDAPGGLVLGLKQ